MNLFTSSTGLRTYSLTTITTIKYEISRSMCTLEEIEKKKTGSE